MTVAAVEAGTDKLGFPVVPCSRCCGRGTMEEYRGIYGGTCFKCLGTGYTRVGKSAKAYKAYKEALAADQLATVADLKEGDVFTFGGANHVTKWERFVGIEADPSAQNTANGWFKVRTNKGGLGIQSMSFPVRINHPGAVDVNIYLAQAK